MRDEESFGVCAVSKVPCYPCTSLHSWSDSFRSLAIVFLRKMTLMMPWMVVTPTTRLHCQSSMQVRIKLARINGHTYPRFCDPATAVARLCSAMAVVWNSAVPPGVLWKISVNHFRAGSGFVMLNTMQRPEVRVSTKEI